MRISLTTYGFSYSQRHHIRLVMIPDAMHSGTVELLGNRVAANRDQPLGHRQVSSLLLAPSRANSPNPSRITVWEASGTRTRSRITASPIVWIEAAVYKGLFSGA